MARRYVCRLRSQSEQRCEEVASGLERRSRCTSLHRNLAAPRLSLHRAARQRLRFRSRPSRTLRIHPGSWKFSALHPTAFPVGFLIPTAGKLWAAGIGGFALALVFVAWFRLSHTGSFPDAAPVRLVPLTSFSNDFSKGSFSPDGNQVAFSWDGDQPNGGIDIYVKQIGNEKPLRVTQQFGFNFFPVFSPDGRYIAFLHSNHNEVAGIYVIPALGGPPRKLYEFTRSENCKPGLSWSPDGKYLLFSDHAGDQPCSVKQFTIEDLSVRQFSSPPVPSTGDWDAQYSPDGKNVAFIRNTKDVEDIYVMPASGGSPRRVTFDNRLMSGLGWTPDSKELLFSSNRGGASWGLWRMAAGGGTPQRVSVGSEQAYMPTLSLKGNRLVFASGFWNENIWRLPIGPDHRIGET